MPPGPTPQAQYPARAPHPHPTNPKGAPPWHSAPSPSPRPSACTPARPPCSSRRRARPGLDVEIGRPGEDAVDATSILGVMALGAKYGEEVVLTAEGDGADAALDGLVALLSRDLDAE